ncbi:MAG: hypothetical protein AAF825_10245 [Pseudomonadota bacterium]
MVLARFARGDGAAIVIDGVVALIAVTALVLTAFIGIRAAIDTFRGQNLSTLVGVRLLAPDDVLVTFEDFELGAPGWSQGRHEAESPGLGGLLGRFGGTGGREAVSRVYVSPEQRQYALVSFDLHAIDDWDLQDVIVFVNGVEVLRQNFTTRSEATDRQRSLIADLPWVRTTLRLTERSGVERGYGAGSPDLADQTLRVRMVLFQPTDELHIGFGSTLEDETTDGRSWAVDNLQIVMTDHLPGS